MRFDKYLRVTIEQRVPSLDENSKPKTDKNEKPSYFLEKIIDQREIDGVVSCF